VGLMKTAGATSLRAGAEDNRWVPGLRRVGVAVGVVVYLVGAVVARGSSSWSRAPYPVRHDEAALHGKLFYNGAPWTSAVMSLRDGSTVVLGRMRLGTGPLLCLSVVMAGTLFPFETSGCHSSGAPTSRCIRALSSGTLGSEETCSRCVSLARRLRRALFSEKMA